MHGSNPQLIGSVAASLLAAVALVAGGRQAARAVAVESEPAEELAAPSEPADEPAPQRLSAADAALVARMDDEVLVIDGRPRYHGGACPHLVGQQVEPLPVSEAVRLGFTPCSRCQPASELLARARPV